MTVLNERLSMASSLSDDKAVELDAWPTPWWIRFRHKSKQEHRGSQASAVLLLIYTFFAGER